MRYFQMRILPRRHHYGIIPFYRIVSSAEHPSCHFSMEKLVGNSRVQPGFRVTLTKEVRRKLRTKVGDIVAFIEDERGNIVLRRAELKPV